MSKLSNKDRPRTREMLDVPYKHTLPPSLPHDSSLILTPQNFLRI
jgi:hypothetical protein